MSKPTRLWKIDYCVCVRACVFSSHIIWIILFNFLHFLSPFLSHFNCSLPPKCSSTRNRLAYTLVLLIAKIPALIFIAWQMLLISTIFCYVWYFCNSLMIIGHGNTIYEIYISLDLRDDIQIFFFNFFEAHPIINVASKYLNLNKIKKKRWREKKLERKRIDWKEISNLQRMNTKWTFQNKQNANKNQSEALFTGLRRYLRFLLLLALLLQCCLNQ